MSRSLFIIIAILFLTAPLAVSAISFERDLYFGMRNNIDVLRLQEFLTTEGVYGGPVTGNFFNLTLEGVKKFQERENITPVAGYFGLKTRARANEILAKQATSLQPPVSQETIIADLLLQIKALERQILAFQGGSPAAPNKISSPEPVPALIPSQLLGPLPALSPKPAVLEISGGGEFKFPDTSLPSLKIGDLTIRNGTANDIFFSQVLVDVFDEMNTSINRGREVILVLRDEKGDEMSRTKFTFNSNVPQVGTPHRNQVGLSYPVLVKTGETKILSLWIDALDYVLGGKLEFRVDTLLASTSISPTGGFKSVFTR